MSSRRTGHAKPRRRPEDPDEDRQDDDRQDRLREERRLEKRRREERKQQLHGDREPDDDSGERQRPERGPVHSRLRRLSHADEEDLDELSEELD